jgi:hypothetical protein
VAEKAEGFVAIDKDGELVALGDKVDCNHALAPWAKQLADSEPVEPMGRRSEDRRV